MSSPDPGKPKGTLSARLVELGSVGLTYIRLVGLASIILLISGCTAIQLQTRTTQLAPSITEIEKDQILRNISRFIDACEDQSECNVVPDQFVLGGGQAQGSNQQQGPNLVANLTGLVFKSLSFQDQNQWTQSWSITPVTDFADLERLRALCRYAVLLEPSTDSRYDCKAFINDYNRQLVKSVDATGRVPATLIQTPETHSGNELPKVTPEILPLPLPWNPDPKEADPKYACDGWRHKLRSTKWISWDNQKHPEGAKSVGGRYPHHLYIVDKDLQNFMIWILGATPNTSGAASKSGGGPKTSLLLNAE